MSKLFIKSPPPPTEYTEEQTQQNGYDGLLSTYHHRLGQKLTVPNRMVTKLAFILKRSDSPTGNLYFQIYRVSDNGVILSKIWGDASLLPTTPTWIEVEFDTPAVIDEAVRMCAYFTGGGAGEVIYFYYQNTDVKADEHYTKAFDWAWTDETGYDAAYRYKYYEV
ncbi:hypothetical protein ES703_96095 [subsurface metagenome]